MVANIHSVDFNLSFTYVNGCNYIVFTQIAQSYLNAL